MKKFLKRTGYFLLVIILLANLFIVFTGRFYLYKGVWNTYLKGRTGPSALEYQIFENREIARGQPQPWPKSASYNRKEIPADLLTKFKSIETGAFLVIRRDSLLSEQYWGEFSDRSYTNSFSMAKTYVGVLLGCAIEDGYIKSIDQPLGDFLPEYNQGELKNITLLDLVQMSSGIAFDEDYSDPLAYPAEAYYGKDLSEQTFRYREMNDIPGKRFRYLSGNTQLLGMALVKATGKHMSDYASEKLWSPMGCEQSAFWSLDHKDGTEKTFCCINSNARDFARLGKLYLDSGRWNGKQLVPETFALQPREISGLKNDDGTPNVNYSYGWWRIPDYKGHFIFYARGILGQYVICIPDEDMIIVRLGEGRLPNDSDDTPADVYWYLDAALSLAAQ